MKEQKETKVSNVKIYKMEDYSIKSLLEEKYALQKEKRSSQYIAALGFATSGIYGGGAMIANGILNSEMSKSTAALIIVMALVGLYGVCASQKYDKPIEEVNNKILNYNKTRKRK